MVLYARDLRAYGQVKRKIITPPKAVCERHHDANLYNICVMTTPRAPVDFESYFGPRINPHVELPRPELHLPSCYDGTSTYLTNGLIGSITASYSLNTATLLPLSFAAIEDNIAWDEYFMSCTEPRPVGRISRITKQEVSMDKDRVYRFGSAFSVKHGFSQTVEGRESYVREFESIRDSVIEYLAADTVKALLDCAVGFPLLMDDVNNFARVQKIGTGWTDVRSRALRELGAQGITPDTWVVGQGVKAYIKDSDCLVYEAPHTNTPEPPALTNIERRRTIGEYTVQVGSSKERTIEIYDEDHDDFNELAFSDGLEHCQRFDETGSIASHGFSQGAERDGYDMFFTEAHPLGVEYFGHMRPADLPLDAIHAWTASVLSQFDSIELSELNEGCEALVRLVTKLDDVPTQDDARANLYFACVDDAYQQSLGETNLHIELRALITSASKSSLKKLVPYGFGSYEGISELARYTDEQLDMSSDARKAVRAVDTLLKKLVHVCGDSFFLKGDLSATCVFDNLLHRRSARVMHKTTTTSLTCSDALGAYLHAKSATCLAKDGAWTDTSWFIRDALINDRADAIHAAGGSLLERAVSLAFIGAPVTKQSLSRFIMSGCAFPFNIIYARPYQTYDMSSAACFKRGENTGATVIGHVDFQLSDNLAEETHNGNFVVYSKPIIRNKKHVHVAEDVFCTAYRGGTGATFFHDSNNHKASALHGSSLFALLVPYSSEPYPNPIDLKCRGVACARASHASADFYLKLWKWDDGFPNTVCFQGHQSTKSSVEGQHGIVINNTGHWGPRVYPGVGRARVGLEKML
jgi:hypothetical protein